jgi:hypothetical protein
LPEPTREHLRRQIIRLVHARVDVLCAAALADELLVGREDGASEDKDISYRSWGLLTGMVVSYARPFTQSYAYGALEEKWSKFNEREDLEKHHRRLLEHRKTLLAHNDLTPHREVVVFASGSRIGEGVLKRPVVTEGRSPINFDGIREVRELFAFQEERMNAELLELSASLEELEKWEQGAQVRLTHDDV